MLKGLWGKKIGMTQLFSDEGVVTPVTAIELGGWFVTQIKTIEHDGYNAIQVGRVKDRHVGQPFDRAWLKKPARYFSVRREIQADTAIENVSVGDDALSCEAMFAEGDAVDVFGITKGCGFAGVVRRHGFAGGCASHGGKKLRAPGAMSFMRSQGRVIKGKALPGHMGAKQRATQNLRVMRVMQADNIALLKGSIPGKSGTLIFVRKRG